MRKLATVVIVVVVVDITTLLEATVQVRYNTIQARMLLRNYTITHSLNNFYMSLF